MLKVCVAGGSGYGGVELIQILLRHPDVEIVSVSSERHAGTEVTDLYPHLRDVISLHFSTLKELVQEDCDVLFLALPHGQAMKVVPEVAEKTLVIDLSGDFRLDSPETFQEFYGFAHQAMKYQSGFVYGLTEINREQIGTTRRISNPGCFATASLLALHPLYKENCLDGPVFVDSKTGSSGSGRNPSEKTHHPRRTQSLFPYKPFRHQHLPEMRQLLSNPANPLIFQAHSTPLVRGIFASHYTTLKDEFTAETVLRIYRDYYSTEHFVRLVPGCPDASSVQHSNFTDIGIAVQDSHLIVWSTLDNLGKGAAGQAVQNMNIALGIDETTALGGAPAFP
jgi:N-acetyl-gamma-glutamyl-phosphate reductase